MGLGPRSGTKKNGLWSFKKGGTFAKTHCSR